MNSLLISNRPTSLSDVEFKEMWGNSSHTLEAFYKTILSYYPTETVVANDFTIPNHYAKLVWQAAQRDMLDKIIALLPEKLTTRG